MGAGPAPDKIGELGSVLPGPGGSRVPHTRPGWVDMGMEGLTETDTMGATAQARTGGVYVYSRWFIPG